MIICSWYVLVKDTWYDAYPNPVEGNPGCGCSKRGEEDPGQGNHLLAMAALGRGLPAEATIDQAAAKPVAIVTAAAAPRSLVAEVPVFAYGFCGGRPRAFGEQPVGSSRVMKGDGG